jgi:hypothetical protein
MSFHPSAPLNVTVTAFIAHKSSPESVHTLVEERRLKRENHADLLELVDTDSNPTIF